MANVTHCNLRLHDVEPVVPSCKFEAHVKSKSINRPVRHRGFHRKWIFSSSATSGVPQFTGLSKLHNRVKRGWVVGDLENFTAGGISKICPSEKSWPNCTKFGTTYDNHRRIYKYSTEYTHYHTLVQSDCFVSKRRRLEGNCSRNLNLNFAHLTRGQSSLIWYKIDFNNLQAPECCRKWRERERELYSPQHE